MTKIVIIGGGLAGLTTAYRLTQQGVDVTLYEAKNRLGGRVFTVTINGHSAELGAQNINDGGEATHLYRLIGELGFSLSQRRVNLDFSYYDGEKLFPIHDLLKKKNFNRDQLKKTLRQLASKSHNMKEVLDGLIEKSDPLYQVLRVRLAAYEGGGIETLSPLYAETLFHMLLGGISSAHQVNEEEGNHVDIVRLEGGNANLPERLGQILGSRIRLNHPLIKIKKNEQGSYQLLFRNGEQTICDRVVLAIPASVYQDIAFEDEVIPSEKLQSIRSIRYGENAKIMVPFSSISLGKKGVVTDQIVSFFDSSRTLLTVYYTGQASFFSSATIEKTYRQARPMIEKEFRENSPPIVPPIFARDQNFIDYTTPVGYSWPNDPFVKGSYSYISAGQETLLTTLKEERGEKFRALFAPIDQHLYFAGEHTSILSDVPGTMEAACESGERIARSILNEK